MCGGEPEDFAKAKAIMECYAKAIVHAGPAGAGQLTKMVNQICIAGLVQGLAEGLHFAKRAGLDLGAPATLQRYERWRRTDSAAVGLGAHLFTLLFSNDHSLIRTARGLGLSIVDQIPVARRFFMRTAGGEVGDLPALLRGDSLHL